MAEKGSHLSHCKKGHLHIPENRTKAGGCRLCQNARSKKHRMGSETIHQYWRDRQLLKRYNLTRQQVIDQFDKQDGQCAGCKKVFGKEHSNIPCVDHCHDTNLFRGLLCHSCNRGIGLLKHNITTLQNLILYLQAFQERLKSVSRG
jgi:hypothetical protein